MYKMSLTNARVGCYKSQQAQCVLRIGFLLTIQFLDKLRWHLTENIYLQFESVIMVQFNPLDLQCSCGSVVEHCVSSAKGRGFNSQGTHIVIKHV